MDTLTHYGYHRMRRSQKLFGSDLRVTQKQPLKSYSNPAKYPQNPLKFGTWLKNDFLPNGLLKD